LYSSFAEAKESYVFALRACPHHRTPRRNDTA
jgi:hypothetical protein